MINKVILIGNVGKDPETKQVGETKVSSFSLATSEKQKKNNEWIDVTTWHNVKVWGKLSDVVEKYVKKGSMLYLEGKINNGSYDNKDGVKVYFSEVVVFSLQMLSKKEKEETPTSPTFDNKGNVVDENSDLPF